MTKHDPSGLPIRLEEPRFGMTGRHITSLVRREFYVFDVEALDAPEFVPRGSVRGVQLDGRHGEPCHYLSSTIMRQQW